MYPVRLLLTCFVTACLYMMVRCQKKDPNNICFVTKPTSKRELRPLANGKGSILCDTETLGGGWVIIQHRVDRIVDFNRSWADYTAGFTSLRGIGPNESFWLGLENIHQLCKVICKLRIEFSTPTGLHYFAMYNGFSVFGKENNYKMTLLKKTDGNFTKGDILRNNYNADGQPFSTYDAQNRNQTVNCAQITGGGWWWPYQCGQINLNGVWEDTLSGVRWYRTVVNFTEIKVQTVAGANWTALSPPRTVCRYPYRTWVVSVPILITLILGSIVIHISYAHMERLDSEDHSEVSGLTDGDRRYTYKNGRRIPWKSNGSSNDSQTAGPSASQGLHSKTKSSTMIPDDSRRSLTPSEVVDMYYYRTRTRPSLYG